MTPFEGREFSGTTVRFEARSGRKWIECFAPTLVGKPFEQDTPYSRVLGIYRFAGEPKLGPALLYRWRIDESKGEMLNSRAMSYRSFGIGVVEQAYHEIRALIDSPDPAARRETAAEAGRRWREWAEAQFVEHEPRVNSEREIALIDRMDGFRDVHWDAIRVELWLGGRVVVAGDDGDEELILLAAKKPGQSLEDVAAAMYMRALETGRPVIPLEVENAQIIRPAAHTPPIFRFAPSRGA